MTMLHAPLDNAPVSDAKVTLGFRGVVVGWLLYVPATCLCISEMDLLNFTCCHSETEVADQTLYLAQSQYTATGPTSSSTDPITPGAL